MKLNGEINPKLDRLGNPLAWRYEMDFNSPSGGIEFKGDLYKGKLIGHSLKLNEFFKGAPEILFQEIKTGLKKDETGYQLSGEIIDLQYGGYHLNTSGPFSGNFDLKNSHILLVDTYCILDDADSFNIQKLDFSIPLKKLDAAVSRSDIKINHFFKDYTGILTGKFLLSYQTNLIIDSEMKLSNFQYRFIENGWGLVNIKKNKLKGEFNIKTSGGVASVNVESEDLFHKPIQAFMSADNILIAPILSNLKSGFQTKTANFSRSNYKPLVYFIVKSKKAMYLKLTFEDIVVKGSYNDSIFDITLLQFGLFRGNAKFSGVLSNSIFLGSGNFVEGRFREFSEIFIEGPKKLYGKLDMNMKFKILLSNLTNSYADLEIVIKDGLISKFLIQEKISDFLFDIPLDKISFDKIVLKTSFLNGCFDLSSFIFDSKDLQIFAKKGKLSLPDIKLDTDLLFSFSKDYLAVLPNIAQILTTGYEKNGRIEFGVLLKGHYQKPQLSFYKNQ